MNKYQSCFTFTSHNKQQNKMKGEKCTDAYL